MLCGIDEAGRGPVLGPLVIGSVSVNDDTPLIEIGVKDSKKLSAKVRDRMFDEILEVCDSHAIVIMSAEDIDLNRKRKSLNVIEMEMFAESVNVPDVEIVYADCPDVNTMAFGSGLSRMIGGKKVIAEHGADDRYPVVSAASILAKVTRDRMIEDISNEFGVNVGSGYPSDVHTMEFIEKWIKDNGSPPKHTRCSWEPVKQMISKSKNTRISDW